MSRVVVIEMNRNQSVGNTLDLPEGEGSLLGLLESWFQYQLENQLTAMFGFTVCPAAQDVRSLGYRFLKMVREHLLEMRQSTSASPKVLLQVQ